MDHNAAGHPVLEVHWIIGVFFWIAILIGVVIFVRAVLGGSSKESESDNK